MGHHAPLGCSGGTAGVYDVCCAVTRRAVESVDTGRIVGGGVRVAVSEPMVMQSHRYRGAPCTHDVGHLGVFGDEVQPTPGIARIKGDIRRAALQNGQEKNDCVHVSIRQQADEFAWAHPGTKQATCRGVTRPVQITVGRLVVAADHGDRGGRLDGTAAQQVCQRFHTRDFGSWLGSGKSVGDRRRIDFCGAHRRGEVSVCAGWGMPAGRLRHTS